MTNTPWVRFHEVTRADLDPLVAFAAMPPQPVQGELQRRVFVMRGQFRHDGPLNQVVAAVGDGRRAVSVHFVRTGPASWVGYSVESHRDAPGRGSDCALVGSGSCRERMSWRGADGAGAVLAGEGLEGLWGWLERRFRGGLSG